MRARRRSRLALAVLFCAGVLLSLAAVLLIGHCRATRDAPSLPTSLPAGPPAGVHGSPTAGSCADVAPEAQNPAFEREVLDLVNAERRAAGLPALEISEPLAASARWFARDMAEQGYFAPDHATYHDVGGRLVQVCDWSTRIAFFSTGWSALAENIASGGATPRQVVAGWLGSPPHRAKILDRGFSETGVGYWSGGPQGSYWVEDFGGRVSQ